MDCVLVCAMRMSNEGIAFFLFLWASVVERWQVLMVDAKAAAAGANVLMTDTPTSCASFLNIHHYLNRISITAVRLARILNLPPRCQSWRYRHPNLELIWQLPSLGFQPGADDLANECILFIKISDRSTTMLSPPITFYLCSLQ